MKKILAEKLTLHQGGFDSSSADDKGKPGRRQAQRTMPAQRRKSFMAVDSRRWRDGDRGVSFHACHRQKRCDTLPLALPAHTALGIRCPEHEDKVRQMIPFDARQGADHVFVARRNNSLSSTERMWIFACVFAFSMTIALAFATFGAWPVMPFTGLEMAVLYAAFRYVDRHASDYEIIEIRDDRVRLETRVGSQVQCVEFNRHWAQLVTKDASGEPRLALRSHGREVDFGRHLTGRDRERVAREIRQQLRKVS